MTTILEMKQSRFITRPCIKEHDSYSTSEYIRRPGLDETPHFYGVYERQTDGLEIWKSDHNTLLEAEVARIKLAQQAWRDDESDKQQVDVLVRLTFEAPLHEETDALHDRLSDYVIGGCQVFADSLTAPVIIQDILEEAAIYGHDDLGEMVASTLLEIPKADDRLDDYSGHDHCDMSLDTSISMVKSALEEFNLLLKDADTLLTREGKTYLCNRVASMMKNEEEVIRDVLGLRDEEDEADDE